MSSPKLLMICPGALFPLDMASKVRVFNILKAAKEKFEVTFLANCESQYIAQNKGNLEPICSQVLLLPFRNKKNLCNRIMHRVCSEFAHYTAGVPYDLYYSGIINLSASIIENVLCDKNFDVVLFEYWFSSASVELFKKRGIPCILDMHDILWQKNVTSRNSNTGNVLVKKCQSFLDRQYRSFEETAWSRFNGLISINNVEEKYVRKKLPPNIPVVNAGTGVDLKQWQYHWKPANPPRVAFYGALTSKQNEQAALRCAKQIMPVVWAKKPDAQLWLVGANPSNSLRLLETNPLIKVTGFIEQVKDILSSATVLLCPLRGRYGFHGRLIEAMALGVPVVATTDAAYGMDLENENGVILVDGDEMLAERTAQFLISADFAKHQSFLARGQVEKKFSFDATYGRIISFLLSFTGN